jgi:hypothetical protein
MREPRNQVQPQCTAVCAHAHSRSCASGRQNQPPWQPHQAVDAASYWRCCVQAPRYQHPTAGDHVYEDRHPAPSHAPCRHPTNTQAWGGCMTENNSSPPCPTQTVHQTNPVHACQSTHAVCNECNSMNSPGAPTKGIYKLLMPHSKTQCDCSRAPLGTRSVANLTAMLATAFAEKQCKSCKSYKVQWHALVWGCWPATPHSDPGNPTQLWRPCTWLTWPPLPTNRPALPMPVGAAKVYTMFAGHKTPSSSPSLQSHPPSPTGRRCGAANHGELCVARIPPKARNQQP